MTITAYQQTRIDDVTTVIVTSDLVGQIFYHWYLDGAYLGATDTPQRSFSVPAGDQARVEVIDTLDDGFDPLASAPDGWPARRSIFWTASVDSDVNHYRVEQQKAGGDWELLAIVEHDSARWTYTVLTGRLDDRTLYAWRVIPVDAAGNQGTAQTISQEMIVRTPDAPDFAATFDPITTHVTFEEAA